jgi:hypothetical protein
MSSTKDVLTTTLRLKLNNPVSCPEFDLYAGFDEVLSGVRLTAALVINMIKNKKMKMVID